MWMASVANSFRYVVALSPVPRAWALPLGGRVAADA
jgi:hypothetical protein